MDAEATRYTHFVFSYSVDTLAAAARETAEHAFQEDDSENNIATNDWHVEALGEQTLRVREVLWSQKSIGELFSDRSDPAILIDNLNNGRQHSMSLKPLSVVALQGQFITLDNRRAKCLWEHQQHVSRMGGEDVYFRANVYHLPKQLGFLMSQHPIAREFMRKFDDTDGRPPKVRRKSITTVLPEVFQQSSREHEAA